MKFWLFFVIFVGISDCSRRSRTAFALGIISSSSINGHVVVLQSSMTKLIVIGFLAVVWEKD